MNNLLICPLVKVNFERTFFLNAITEFTIRNSDCRYLFQPNIFEGPGILPSKGKVQHSKGSLKGVEWTIQTYFL